MMAIKGVDFFLSFGLQPVVCRGCVSLRIFRLMSAAIYCICRTCIIWLWECFVWARFRHGAFFAVPFESREFRHFFFRLSSQRLGIKDEVTIQPVCTQTANLFMNIIEIYGQIITRNGQTLGRKTKIDCFGKEIRLLQVLYTQFATI